MIRAVVGFASPIVQEGVKVKAKHDTFGCLPCTHHFAHSEDPESRDL